MMSEEAPFLRLMIASHIVNMAESENGLNLKLKNHTAMPYHGSEVSWDRLAVSQGAPKSAER